MQNHNIILLRQQSGRGFKKPTQFPTKAMYGLRISFPLEVLIIASGIEADFGTITFPETPIAVGSNYGTITSPLDSADFGQIA